MIEQINSLSPVITVLSMLIGVGILLTAQVSLFLAIVISQTKPLREDLKEVKLALSNHITDTNKKVSAVKKEVINLHVGQKALETSQKNLETNVSELKTGQKVLVAEVSELKTSQKALETGQKVLVAEVSELKTSQKALETGQKEINGKLDQLLNQSA